MIVGHVRGHGGFEHIGHPADETWFTHVDARVKIIGILALVGVAALLTRPEAVAGALTAAIILAAASGVDVRRLALGLAAALPIIFLASVSMFLLSGWERGFTMLARTCSCVLPLLTLAAGTETFDLFSGLRRLRVPGLITTLLMLTFKFLVLLAEESDRMSVARRARGFLGGRSLWDRYGLAVLSSAAGMLLLRASSRADRVYDALRSKAFRRDMKPWRTGPPAARDAAFLLCLVVVAISLAASQSGVLV